jgi:hypothetical protein
MQLTNLSMIFWLNCDQVTEFAAKNIWVGKRKKNIKTLELTKNAKEMKSNTNP